MAFWGVEVKPGKPFSHECDDSKGRLHISMATLGFGSGTTRSTLQCNVGNRSPVYLCSLYPGTTESLQLNLELEKDEEVIFSVIGPRSIHLCGYYLGRSMPGNLNLSDESESYGEDIANTETDSSGHSDEDEYGGSFIDDDGDFKVFPPSPISDKEGTFHDNKMKDRKRRLRKKYQSLESDDNEDSEENTILNDSTDDVTKEVDNEDYLPISSVFKSNDRQMILDELLNDSGDEEVGGSSTQNDEVDELMNDSGDKEVGDASTQNDEDNGNSIIETNLKITNVLIDSQTQREAPLAGHLVDSCTVLNVEDTKTLRKKKKGKGKGDGKEMECSFNMHSMELKNTGQDLDSKMDKMTSDLLAGNEQNQEPVDDKKTETMVEILTSTEVGHGKGEKARKKRKERLNDACDSKLVNLPQKNEDNEQPAVNEDVEIADNAVLPGAEKDSEKSRRKKRKKEHVTKGSHIEGDIGYHEDIAEYKANKDKANSNNLIQNVSEGKHQKLTNERSVDCGAHDFADGNQNEGKVKQRKKKSKSQES